MTGGPVPSARTPARHLLGGAPVCSAAKAPHSDAAGLYYFGSSTEGRASAVDRNGTGSTNPAPGLLGREQQQAKAGHSDCTDPSGFRAPPAEHLTAGNNTALVHLQTGSQSVSPSGLDLFKDEHAAQLSAMPHHRQAQVLAFPHGLDARELAASTVRKMEEQGIQL